MKRLDLSFAVYVDITAFIRVIVLDYLLFEIRSGEGIACVLIDEVYSLVVFDLYARSVLLTFVQIDRHR